MESYSELTTTHIKLEANEVGWRRTVVTPRAIEGFGGAEIKFCKFTEQKATTLRGDFVLGASPRPQSETRARAKSGVAHATKNTRQNKELQRRFFDIVILASFALARASRGGRPRR